MTITLISGSAVISLGISWAADWPLSVVRTPILALSVLLGFGAVLGFLSPACSWLPKRYTAFDDYLLRLSELRPWGIAHILIVGMGLGVIALLVAGVIAFAIAVSLFWIVPSVVWLSLFHDVSVVEAANHALLASHGRSEYEGVRGINTDPSLIGLFLFNLAVWLVILVAALLMASPFFALWLRWDKRRTDRLLNEVASRD